MTTVQTSSPDFRSVGITSSAGAPALSPEEQLLALMVHAQATQMKDARQTINLNAEQLEELREQVKKALDDAREAKKDAGFWGGLSKLFKGDLATLASAVAALAATVATAGSAAAVLAVVAAAATFAANHAEELGIPPEVATAVAIGASVAALCCGNASGLLDLGGRAGDAARGVETWSTVAQHGLKIGGSACDARAAGFEHDAAYAHAEARSADGQQDLVNIDIDEALDRLSSALDNQLSAVQQTSSMQQQTTATNHALLSSWGGVA
jgi:hypothetical protein